MPPYATHPYLKLRRPNPNHVKDEAERDALFVGFKKDVEALIVAREKELREKPASRDTSND